MNTGLWQDGGKSWGEEIFSWRTSWGTARAREGTLVCFLGNPTRFARLCRAAFCLFIHSSTWRQRMLSWHFRDSECRRQFLTWILLPEFRLLNQEPSCCWIPLIDKDASRENLNIAIVFNPLFVSLAESRLPSCPHFLDIFLSITFIWSQRWNPTRIHKANAPLAQGNSLPQGLPEARSFGGFQKVSDIYIRNKNSQV